jgi:hypothetical protein
VHLLRQLLVVQGAEIEFLFFGHRIDPNRSGGADPNLRRLAAGGH